MTIFVIWQLIVTLDSIRNSCDVWFYPMLLKSVWPHIIRTHSSIPQNYMKVVWIVFGDFIPIGMPSCRCSHSTFKVLNESVCRFLGDYSKSAIFMPFYLVIVDEIQMEEQLLWCNSSRNDAERKNFLVCHPAKMAIFKTLWHIFFHSCVLLAHRCTIFLCIWDGKYSTGWWPPIGGG